MDELKSQDENKEEVESQTQQPAKSDNISNAPQSSNQQALSTAQTEQQTDENNGAAAKTPDETPKEADNCPQASTSANKMKGKDS
jgi:hypothetical protein